MPGLCSTTATCLTHRFTDGQWWAVETGVGEVHAAMLGLLPAERAAAVGETVTIRSGHNRCRGLWPAQARCGVNHQGQHCGHPHQATWAETSAVLAADLMAGNEDPHRTPPSCWVARSRRCPLRSGPGRFGCAPTPATSPESWPARPYLRRSSLPSGRGGSHRCGASSTTSPRPPGPTRST